MKPCAAISMHGRARSNASVDRRGPRTRARRTPTRRPSGPPAARPVRRGDAWGHDCVPHAGEEGVPVGCGCASPRRAGRAEYMKVRAHAVLARPEKSHQLWFALFRTGAAGPGACHRGRTEMYGGDGGAALMWRCFVGRCRPVHGVYAGRGRARRVGFWVSCVARFFHETTPAALSDTKKAGVAYSTLTAAFDHCVPIQV